MPASIQESPYCCPNVLFSYRNPKTKLFNSQMRNNEGPAGGSHWNVADPIGIKSGKHLM
jgi:hypothetical protein